MAPTSSIIIARQKKTILLLPLLVIIIAIIVIAPTATSFSTTPRVLHTNTNISILTTNSNANDNTRMRSSVYYSFLLTRQRMLQQQQQQQQQKSRRLVTLMLGNTWGIACTCRPLIISTTTTCIPTANISNRSYYCVVSNSHNGNDWHYLRKHSTTSTAATRTMTSKTTARFLSSSSSNNNNISNTTTPPPDFTDNQHSEYEHWVRQLYMTNMYNPVKLGLENIEKIHALLGNPMDDPNIAVIHIAGTNGKGSVALKIAKTLELMNLKVGLFCSPHVSSFRERMQMNSQLISEQEVVEYLPRLYELCKQHNIPATFFELTTALAFMFYAKRNADVVVLETGLGGRLDSTNVVKSPVCSVITSIGLEHTRILGDTIEQIAVEKAGIIKPNRPVLVGPHVPHEVIQQCAKEKGASGYYICDDILQQQQLQHDNNIQQQETVVDYDVENARIATATLRLLEREQAIPKLKYYPIPDDIMRQGTSQRPPCRFEEIQRQEDGITIVLDVAHNPPAMQYLVQKLKATYPGAKFRIIVGMSSDKDTALCGKYILEATDGNGSAIHLVQASHPRAAKLEDILASDTTGLLPNNSHYDLEDRSVTRQVGIATEMAKQNQEILVVCGSVFLMAEAREALGFDEPRDSDYIAEVAGAHLRHGQENFDDSKANAKTA